MDATTRWETEALRSGASRRPTPPKPSRKRAPDDRNWVTLKEAEAATGIPSNTLRKWVRKSDLPSYLESDGDLALRMVDLDAVISRASELGRTIAPSVEVSPVAERTSPEAPEPDGPPAQAGPSAAWPDAEAEAEIVEDPDTMIVPVDAWNRMLDQLGNLHEAGQQLADARERAAKAETEAQFLRERLLDLRNVETPQGAVEEVPSGAQGSPHAEDRTPEHVEDVTVRDQPPETTTYWRYVTTGWRQRRRRSP